MIHFLYEQDDLAHEHSSACGKIILCGEYAVVFGYPGIAIPAPLQVIVTFTEDSSKKNIEVLWTTNHQSPVTSHWTDYCNAIIDHCTAYSPLPSGVLTIENHIPLGKGMGSSTALVIAIVRCLFGDNEELAQKVENTVNPGNSGIDFAVIWNEKPIVFTKESKPETINLPNNILNKALLIDTGTPNEQTPELVAWVTARREEYNVALETIGSCTKRVQEGEDLSSIIRNHHQAQISLGIVTDEAKTLITKIEQEGGYAKVIGAGSRSGGCGMILAFDIDASTIPSQYPITKL